MLALNPRRRCAVASAARARQQPLALSGLAVAAALGLAAGASAETWRGLTIAPGHRCSHYDKRRDYVRSGPIPMYGSVPGGYRG